MDKAIDYLINRIRINENDTVVLASSGGPDSMALFDVLLKIRTTIPFKIVCAHVNHNVREESTEEAEFLRNFCQKESVAFEIMKIEEYHSDNFHNEARNIRYCFFNKIIEKYNANYLMTAHHGDDLMETVLMRLVRGASLNGYKGFDVVSNRGNYKIVKPLVFYTKEEIQSYDDENNIPYVVDKSNFSDKYTRNRYRKYVLPFLKSENKEVHKKFLKYSNILNMCEKYITKEVNKLEDDVFDKEKIIINRFLECDDIIKYEIINSWLHIVYGDKINLISDVHVEKIMDLIYSNRQNSYMTLPNGIKIYREYNNLKYTTDDMLTVDYKYELVNNLIIGNGKFNYLNETDINDNSVCLISKKDISLPLYVRNRRLGDRILLKKVLGHQKIKDIFIDKKIPVKKRNNWPIVVDAEDNIIWIPNIKKSQFCVKKEENYDIIIKYSEIGGKYEKE